MATTIYNRIKIKIGLIADFISAQYAGLIGIVSNIPTIGSAFVWFDGTDWKYSTPMNARGESLPNAVKIGSVLALDSSNNHTANSYSVNGSTVVDSSLNTKVASVWTGGTIRIDGSGNFTGLSAAFTSLSPNKIPRPNASNVLVDSCFGDDGTNASITRPLTLNGATRKAWNVNYMGSIQVTDASSIGVFADAASDALCLWSNAYYDGAYKTVNSKTLNHPSRFYAFDGGIYLETSLTTPVAGATISDMTTKWSVSRQGGCGFFGVPAPTSRPTVSAPATDAATTMALVNQIRLHLINCGLVQ